MARSSKLRSVLLTLLAASLLFSSCGEKPKESETETEIETETETESKTESETVAETETETKAETEAHTHEYKLSETVDGTCLELGYRRFACTCGLSYKELIPSAHSYTEVTDTTGNYIKKVCSACGDYKIVRKQSYIYNVDFENVKDAQAAANVSSGGQFYTASGTSITLEKDSDGTHARVLSSNYCITDASGTMKSGSKFVISMDVKLQNVQEEFSLIAFGLVYANSTTFGSGLVVVEADGTLSFSSQGNSKYNKTVKLSDKGYTNITVVGDFKTMLFDIYVNEELVRTGVAYSSKVEGTLTSVYVRYFDREKKFVALADNIKVYKASSPEFIVPTSGIVFAG